MSTYGIDLGTTYSCIARLDSNGNPEVIRNNEDDSNTVASVVFFENESNVIVGQAAKENVETDGDRVVQFVKREIGKREARTYEFDGKTYTPVEISALILTRLKNLVEDQGGTIEDVVITVPAYFGLEERSATKQAGELAGLHVLSLINEPTAAALSYCARQFQEDRTILVYDLGGGTFDVTVLKMSMTQNNSGRDVQKITVLATDGDDRLGGKDWDDKLYNHILRACCDDNGLTPEEVEAETRQDIRSKVEEAKRKLSKKQTAKVRIDVNGSRTEIAIKRADFEQMTSDLVARTMNFVDATLEKVPAEAIDTVLLVGGSTYMPMIINAVEEKFPGKVQQHDPDQAVAKGAAIYASMLVEEVDSLSAQGEETSGDAPHAEQLTSKFTVEDQTPRSFGPGVVDMNGAKHKYVLENFIKIGEKMPAVFTKTYYPLEDNQELVRLRAFENISTDDTLIPSVDEDGNPQATDPAHKVKLLGELIVNLPPNTSRDTPIKVTFKVDASGVHVEAVNTKTDETFETFLRTESDIDVERSAVHQLRISSD
ncbi:MAG: Hsp70 family protein [Selenomonadaceae bacterium]|nr:Hsp70 family protein [Selenomonadaceae bacterium]MBR3497429.1 Hsp70 family protein [Selenomonadaceae bacterium]